MAYFLPVNQRNLNSKARKYQHIFDIKKMLEEIFDIKKMLEEITVTVKIIKTYWRENYDSGIIR